MTTHEEDRDERMFSLLENLAEKFDALRKDVDLRDASCRSFGNEQSEPEADGDAATDGETVQRARRARQNLESERSPTLRREIGLTRK